MQMSGLCGTCATAMGKERRWAVFAMAASLYSALFFFFDGFLGLTFQCLPYLSGVLIALVCACSRKRRILLAGVISAVAILAAVALPSARNGIAALSNRLFARSEAFNRYFYNYFSVWGDALQRDERVARCLLAIVEASATTWVIAMPCPGAMAISAGLCGLQIYFGVVSGTWQTLSVFICLIYMALWQREEFRSWRHQIALLVCLLLMSALVFAMFPGVDATLERFSEDIKDRFARSAIQGTITLTEEETISLTRHESQLQEENVHLTDVDGQAEREYQKKQAYQQELSLPRQIDYLKLLGIFLGMVLLLIGPFLPLIWMDRKRKKARELRKAFETDNLNRAVCAMFQHIAECLSLGRVQMQTISFSHLTCQSAFFLSEEYCLEYEKAIPIWLQAAYSDHPISCEQKEMVYSLLRQTERMVWENATRKQRWKLRYADCLISPEDL